MDLLVSSGPGNRPPSSYPPFGDSTPLLHARLIRSGAILSGLLTLLSALLALAEARFGMPLLGSMYPGTRTIALSAALIWILIGTILAISTAKPLRGAAALAAMVILAAIAAVEAFELPLSLLGTHSSIEIRLTGLGQTLLSPASLPISPAASVLIIVSAAALFIIIGIAAPSPENRRARDAVGIIGFSVTLVSFTFAMSYILGNPLLYGTPYIPIAALSAISALFAGTGLIAAAGPDAFPLRHVTGTSTRARLIRTFVPLSAAIIVVQQVVFSLLPFGVPGNSAVLLSASIVVFALITLYLVSRVSGSVGAALDLAGKELIQKNEDLNALNEELTATDEELRQNISQLAQSEQRLRESEERFRTVADFTLDWEFWLDPAGKFVYVSPSADTILGRPSGAYSEIDPFLRDVVHPEDLSLRLAHLEDELSGKGPSELEFRIVRPDGEVRWIHHICRPVYDAAGKFLGTRGSNRDITDRHLSQEALRRSEEKYRIIFETANEGIWTTDADRKTILVNPRMADLLGYTVAEILGRTPSEFLHPDQEPVRQKTLEDLKKGVIISREFRFRRKDGSDLWVISNASPVLDNKGHLLQTISLLTDITDWKKAEEDLRAAEEKSRHIIASAPAMIYEMDLAGSRFLSVNDPMCSILGYTREELMAMKPADLIDEESRDLFSERIQSMLADKPVPEYVEYRGLTKNGHEMYVAVRSSFVHRNGVPVSAVVVAHDITERKKAEKALREAHERTRSILESIADTFYSLDNEWRFTVVNPAAERAPFGRPASELLGKVIWDLFPKLVGTHIHRHYLDAARYHTLEHYEAQSPLNSRWYEVFMQGRKGGVDVYMRDITERRLAEEALRKSYDRLEVLVQERTVALETAVAYNRSLIEAGLDPMVTINPDGKISDVNIATVDMTGFSREELIGTDFSDFFTEPDKARAGYQKVFREGFVRDYPLGMRHRDGRITPVMYNATIFYDEKGVTSGAFAVARDISALKKAERDLEKAHTDTRMERQRLYEVLETLPVYVCLLDADYRMPFANRYFRNTFGYSLIRKCYEFLFNRTEPCEDCESYKAMKTRAPHHWYWTGPNGRNYDIYDFPFTDMDGSPLILEMGIDITEQKKAEEAVRKAAAYNRSLIEASIDPMVTIRPDGKIGDVNAATVTATGLTREELIGTDFSDYFTEPDRAKAGYETAFREGSVTDYGLGIRHRDGRVTPVLYNATVYRDVSCEVTGVFAAARDITEQKRAEEVLRNVNEELERRVAERTAELAGANEELRATNEELGAAHEELNVHVEELQKTEDMLRRNAAELTETLAEKEMLLSEIHHRVKNNLTAFISLLSLEGSYEESDAGRQLKTDLQNRARSMALIHETLYRTKKFSHVDMGVYLTTLVSQITTSYATRRDVHVTVAADGVVLDLARATPCGLIINELVTNSFKYAFPAGFDCAAVRNGPCTISVSLESEDNLYRLIVSDNGAGLPAGINLPTAKSLGLKLVNFLAKHQLQAAIFTDTSAGTSIEFQFKKDPGFP